MAPRSPPIWRPVAYVDPGNVAAKSSPPDAKVRLTCWCGWLVLANAMSVLIQYQSAKLGIVTKTNPWPELLVVKRMSDAGRFHVLYAGRVIAMGHDLAR